MPKNAVVFGTTENEDDQVLNLTYKMIPTGIKFHACDDRHRCIVGPVAGGKSAVAVWELLFRAMKQKVNKHGIRASKFAVVRNTYPDLLNTTLRDFLSWLPEKQYPNLGYSLTVNYSKPIIAKLYLRLPAGYNGYPKETVVDSEIVFLALDIDEDVRKLRGLSLTGAWINEACQISKTIFDTVCERIGRFPHKKDGGFNWTGVWMDTNPPEIDSWIPLLFEMEHPKGYTIFHQPPAILELPKKDPKEPSVYVPNMGQGEYPPAENIENLVEGFDYYLTKTAGRNKDYIRTMLQGFYGSIMGGKPVYTEYVDDIHRAKNEQDVPLYRGIPLRVGLDFGNTPSCVFTQITPRGKLVVLDELCCGLNESQLKGKPRDRYFGDMGIRNFALHVLKPYVANRYADMEIIYVGDPAGGQRSQTNESTVLDELRDCGLDVKPGRTNIFLPRREAVEGYMMRRDGFLVSPRCLWLLEGLQKYYKYRAVQTPNGTAYASEPDKREAHTHIQDALQYIAMDTETSYGKPGLAGQGQGGSSNARREVLPSSWSYA